MKYAVPPKNIPNRADNKFLTSFDFSETLNIRRKTDKKYILLKLANETVPLAMPLTKSEIMLIKINKEI